LVTEVELSDFSEPVWNELLAIIDNDDGEAVAARAFELQDSGVFDWTHPDDEVGKTPMMVAYWFGKLKAANALAKAGANYSAQDVQGRRVSWYAQNYGRGCREEAGHARVAVTLVRISMQEKIREVTGQLGEADAASPTRRGRGSV
jgi:hypothetical protein